MKSSFLHERILLVEDDAVLADSITDLLEDEGYAVTRCAHATDLEASLAGRGFDLALIELSVGEQSGLALVPRLRRLNVQAEVVVMTGKASLHTAMEAFHSGVHAYLPKPFANDELLVITRRALAQVALKRERQALSERLAMSESLYRSVVETVESCIVGLDDAGMITFANRFATRCLGEGKLLLGQSLVALTEEVHQRGLARALGRARSGESVRDQDALHPLTAGARTVRWSFSPLHTTHAPIARQARDVEVAMPAATVLAVGQDITDRLALEQRTAASQALAAVGTLTTGLAHEIRNPLNAAKLQLELMERRAKRGGNPELAAKLVGPANVVREEIERLTRMLDEFLSLARPSSPTRVTASVADLFASVLASEQLTADRAGIRLRSELVNPDLNLDLDTEKMRAALLHLVRNSIDAMAPRGHGEIVLRAVTTGAHVELSVLDDGPGLHADMQGRAAFEPFATTKPAGTGLGLALVQSAVAQHGGVVEIINRPEGGTIALIRLGEAINGER